MVALSGLPHLTVDVYHVWRGQALLAAGEHPGTGKARDIIDAVLSACTASHHRAILIRDGRRQAVDSRASACPDVNGVCRSRTCANNDLLVCTAAPASPARCPSSRISGPSAPNRLRSESYSRQPER